MTDANLGLLRVVLKVHFWRHGGIQTSVTTPLVMGHEASGTIAAVGRAVTSVQVGDRVAIEPDTPAGAASPAPEDFVYRLDNAAVSLEEAVLLEPLAVAVHAVRLADIRPGQTVVITGSGTIGLLCAITARAFGAQRIILLDITETKVAFAHAYLGSGSAGVVVETHRMDPTASAEENARTVSRRFGLRQSGEMDLGTAVDTVIEASGAEAAMQLGVYLVKPGGSYVQTGIGQPKPRIPMLALSEKELRVSGCFRYGPGDFSLALNLLSRESLNLKPLISSITPFEQASTAWEMTARGEGVKNLIEGVRD
ncbi:hypothetical protein BDV24DRAFT_167242 [Aspergillus arachidicola]|uniref:D-xylulose reductase n=1 Tax=Aspergillus arachidicola TaxID=656916 RepID=A0A5N6XWI7_9EURO|nr:hypothetical protein BDV24DRAFT_167242 [Aspergillus arachidicola]